MLAYVFVHQPSTRVVTDEYASRLIGFHRALSIARPVGFVHSWVWHLGTGPLGEAFEDWYLIEDWAALGTLNQAAVAGTRKVPHNQVAVLASGGAGAIYELVFGAPTMAARYRTRIAKPGGVSYKTFQPRLEQIAGTNGTLWKRQMALGLDSEFLIDTPMPPDRGAIEYAADVTAMRSIYPS
jgi:hypothetical protein